ncbi:MAG: hypothetical protein QW692_03345 [Nitrososphaerota archaeon]
MGVFLVRVCRDLRIWKLLMRSATIMFFDERGRVRDVELIEKPEILCDVCGGPVAVAEEELERLPMGYAVCDEECIIEVVCDDCRRRYFADRPVYDDLDRALDGG